MQFTGNRLKRPRSMTSSSNKFIKISSRSIFTRMVLLELEIGLFCFYSFLRSFFCCRSFRTVRLSFPRLPVLLILLAPLLQLVYLLFYLFFCNGCNMYFIYFRNFQYLLPIHLPLLSSLETAVNLLSKCFFL